MKKILFKTPTKVSDDVYIVGEFVTMDGFFIRSIYYFGSKPEEYTRLGIKLNGLPPTRPLKA